MKELEERLQSEAERFNRESDRSYRIGFSMGYAQYDHGNDTDDTFLKKIDSKMYRNKMQRRAETDTGKSRAEV